MARKPYAGQKSPAAPACLVRADEEGRLGRDRQKFLRRLLASAEMDGAWRELGSAIDEWREHHNNAEPDDGWFRVWSLITYAVHQSNQTKRRKLRSVERKQYQALADRFAVLARDIGNGPLDVLAYHLLPPDNLAALGLRDWQGMDSLERDAAAHKLLNIWPSASEILTGLASLAQKLSDDAMTRPRPDDRSRGRPYVRAFVWSLGNDFKAMFGTPMLGTVANIANAALALDEQISKGFVQEVLRGTKR